MKNIFVFVYLPGDISATPAGLFKYDDKELVGTFSYGKRYIEKHAYAISPDLPISTDEYIAKDFNGLFGAFRDSLPDYWGRLVFSSLNKRPIEDVSEHDLLLSGGASMIGNLSFRLSLDSPEPVLSLPGYSSLEGIIKAAETIQSGGEVEKAYQQILQQGSGLGGMRPKCTIEMNNKLWIAKFPAIGDHYNAVKIEAASMRMAQMAGITIPTISVKSIAGKDVFFIERFDRQFLSAPDKNNSGYTRHGYISALALLNKYETDRDFGYQDFADVLRKNGDIKGSHELFKRMLFSIAIRNTDDHAKNHGFITTNNNIRLSPAFDITPTASTLGVSTNFDLAINVGQQGRSATIENALSSYKRFGITYHEALKNLTDVTRAISQWEAVFKEIGVSSSDTERFACTMNSAKERLFIQGDMVSTDSDDDLLKRYDQ
ncbi:type II toxin-antitoxin system HipA family toxin [Methylobacter svalbardensis]|uniref:type II toxin-antitoxin system HipA family toxin n=1 Tax=Methylobacter svalbardensis TaxID=3080016 RepID=UPI0030EBF39B